MNEFEKKALEFLNYKEFLVKSKNLTACDSLFDVLDCISLQKGYHIGLKLAEAVGLGDESWFYTYSDEDLLTGVYRTEDIMQNNRDVFKNLVVKQSAMGAWQVYLLFISITILPTFWHGGYIVRHYFFDRENFKGIKSSWTRGRVHVGLSQIPQPVVEEDDGTFVVSCPYWNDWKGLVLETLNVKFNSDGTISLSPHSKVLYKFHCGICY